MRTALLVSIVWSLAAWTVFTGCTPFAGKKVDVGSEDAMVVGDDAAPSDMGTCPLGQTLVAGACVQAWAEETYAKAQGPHTNQRFGYSVSLSEDGTRLAVGVPYDMDGSNESGAVEVFVREAGAAGSWRREARLRASNADTGDRFGWSVALSADGRMLAVGAPGEDSNATGVGGNQVENRAAESGAVYVFTLSESATPVWSQQWYIKASNTGADDVFGTSVSLSGDGAFLAVGAPGEASNRTGVNPQTEGDESAVGSGAAYVFQRDREEVMGWTQLAYLKGLQADAGDNFGASVSLSDSGNMLAVGVPFEDSAAIGGGSGWDNNGAEDAGAVYVFEYVSAEWTERRYLKASNTGAGDWFGARVALSGNGRRLAVGAFNEGSGGTEGDNAAPGAGAAYVFFGEGINWVQEAYVKASNVAEGDHFGASVSLSADGTRLAVGAIHEASAAVGVGGEPGNDAAPSAGAAYLFAYAGPAWQEEAYVKASNTETNDYFGHSVALAADGTRLAVGAIGEDSAVGGPVRDPANNAAESAGAVYVFGMRPAAP